MPEKESEKEYLKSVELEPNNTARYNQVAEFYLKMNRPEDLLSSLKKYNESDLADVIFVWAEALIISGNKNEAFDSVCKFAKSYKEYLYEFVGEAFIWMEEYDSARLYLESALNSGDDIIFLPAFQVYLALSYAKTNQHQQAQVIINQLIDKSEVTSVGSPEYFLGWYYSGIGKIDSTFYWLEKAYDKHSPEMPWLKVTPVFINLKNDARYRDLYARTGHKAYDEYLEGMKK